MARSQAGVVSRRQLLGAGTSASQIGRMVRSGALTRLHSGLYLVRGAPLGGTAALWRAVLATGGVLGFATACHLWDMIAEPPAHIHVIVATRPHPAACPGVTVHRRDLLPRRLARRDGLPVTARVDSLLDHLTTLRFSDAATLADRALQRRWLRPADLARRLDEYAGRPGVGTLRRIAAQLGDGAAADSERALHRLLRRAGLRGWLPNYRLSIGGRPYYVDLAFPAARIAVEIDGLAFHTDAERFQGDRHRQNDLVGAGWTVLRFTWWDLETRPDYVIGRIRSLLSRSG
jgi:very-short-patch-repair endonuclease